MFDDKPAKPTFTRRFLRLIVMLALISGIFGLGYYTGVGSLGKDPVDSLKTQVQTMTASVVEKSSELKRDLTLRHNLNKAKAMLLEVKDTIQQKNFGKAQDEVDKVIILLTEARAMPDTHEQVEIQIDNLRTRLLDVQDDVADLKSAVTSKITVIAEDIEQLRNTVPSL
ncbi:MAG TPA: hypothetical protein EYN18_05645 [Nitrospirales bacterium]|nr:hypothetical protein [Nitrospirales bacterium]HIO21865.1 hypothetical protein [Nitrospirales bacterium]